MIATPLNAILEEQRQRFGEGCIIIDNQFLENLREGLSDASIQRVKEGNFRFLLGHPEQLVDPVFKQCLMLPKVSKKVKYFYGHR